MEFLPSVDSMCYLLTVALFFQPAPHIWGLLPIIWISAWIIHHFFWERSLTPRILSKNIILCKLNTHWTPENSPSYTIPKISCLHFSMSLSYIGFFQCLVQNPECIKTQRVFAEEKKKKNNPIKTGHQYHLYYHSLLLVLHGHSPRKFCSWMV